MELAALLEEQGFDCFLDSSNYIKGDNWKRVGARALRHTSRLVLVGSPHAVRPDPPRAVTEDPIVRELEIYTREGKRVIPINVGGALRSSEAGDSPLMRFLDLDQLWIPEDIACLANGPSSSTVEDLKSSFGRERQSEKRLKVLKIIAAILFFGMLVSSSLAVVAVRARDDAIVAANDLVRQTKKTYVQKRRADRQAHELEVANVAKATSEYFANIERARSHLRNRLPGWKTAMHMELKKTDDTTAHIPDYRIIERSLVAEASQQFDLDMQPVTVKGYGLFPLATHPSKPWVASAQGRVYLPDISCHIYIHNLESGELVFDIPVMRFGNPAKSGIREVAFSQDGTHLFAGTRWGSLLVFDLSKISGNSTPKEEIELFGHSVIDILAGPNGKTLTAFGRENDLKLSYACVDLGSLEITRKFAFPDNELALGFLGEHGVLSRSLDRLLIRDKESFDVKHHVDLRHGTAVSSVAAFENVLAVSTPNYLTLYDYSDGTYVGECEIPQEGLPEANTQGRLAFSPDGTLIAYANVKTRHIQIWSTIDRSHLLTVPAQASTKAEHLQFEFSRPGNALVVLSKEQIRSYSLKKPKSSALGIQPGIIRDLSVDAARNRAATLLLPHTGSLDPTSQYSADVAIWNTDTDGNAKCQLQRRADAQPVVSQPLVACSGNMIAFTQGFGTLKGYWSGQIQAVILSDPSVSTDLEIRDPDTVSFRRNGELVVTAGRSVFATDPSNIKLNRMWTDDGDDVLGVNRRYIEVCHSEELLFLADQKGFLTILRWGESPKLAKRMKVSDVNVGAISINMSRHLIALGDGDGHLALIDYKNGIELSRFDDAHAGEITSIAWSDDQTFVSGGQDSKLRAWNVNNENQIELVWEATLSTPVRQIFSTQQQDKLLMLRVGCSAIEKLDLEEIGQRDSLLL